MFKLLKNRKGEKGQILPLMLAVLAIGTLTIVPSLNYAASSMNASRSLNFAMKADYAADAGIEDTLWCLARSLPSPTQVTGVNNMQVDIQTENKGEFTLFFGELVLPGVHNDYLDVASTVVDVGGGLYEFTITVTWQSGSGFSVIHLSSVGCRLPPGYTYVDGSADIAGNLSRDPPDKVTDSVGAWMLNWEFGSPAPEVKDTNPIATQTFYIEDLEGTNPLDDYYSWVVADRTDVGEVGEYSGTLYRITAIARRAEDNRGIARIVADALIDELRDIYIIGWQTVNY